MYYYNTRVRYSEITETKKAGILSVINYFQDCCTFESEDRGVGIKWLKQQGTVWMLTSWQIKVNRFPKYCENIKVSTWASGFKYFVGIRNFTIENAETGELLVYAYSEWAYVNSTTGIPVRRIPEEEIEAYGISEPLDKEFEKGKIIVSDESKMVKGEPIVVTEQYIDTNHHVNNGQYVAIAMSVLPEDILSQMDSLKGFRAEYKMQSVKGDTLYPYIYIPNDANSKNAAVILKDENDKNRLIVRFDL